MAVDRSGPMAASAALFMVRPRQPFSGIPSAALRFAPMSARVWHTCMSSTVVQGGFEVPVGRVLALFVDAKKAFLRTDAVGTLNAAPIRARLRMDPLVLHAGAALRF
jgi:hypothetical protein